jgi:chorismate mutase
MTTPAVRGLRGATTVEDDRPDLIADATVELLGVLLERNGLTTDHVISVLFSSTEDLVSAFPATGARHAGFGDVPLMCAREIPVPGSMQRCIRVLLHVETTQSRSELHHVYLRDAKGLRDDLPS